MRGRGVPSVHRSVDWDVSFALSFNAVLLRKAGGSAGKTKGGRKGWEGWGGTKETAAAAAAAAAAKSIQS